MFSEGTASPRVPRLQGLSGLLAAEQERWFYWVPVLMGVGIGLYFWLPIEPHVLTAFALPAVAAGLWVMAPRHVLLGLATSALLCLSLGFALAKLRVEWVRAPVLAKQMTAEVTGWLEQVEPTPGTGRKLTLRVTALGDLAPEARPVRVSFTMRSSDADFEAGDAVRARVTLMPPPGPALPGGFDFARKVWFERLGAVGYARSTPKRDPHAGEAPWDLQAWSAIERLRHQIGRRIAMTLPGETGAIATALIAGERGGITEATNAAYRDSGLIHVLSISGLHMAIMAGAVFFIVRLLLAAIPSLALRYPIKKWAAAAAMIGALGYLLISGMAFPTVRSAIMIAIMLLAVLLERPALALRNVVLAAIVILVLFPESLLDAGFQMSFAAVAALLTAYEALRGRERSFEGSSARVLLFFGGIVLSTLIASAAVAPFGAYHFHRSQQYAVLANLVAVPICNLVVMPAALATLLALPLGLEALPLWGMGLGIDLMSWTAARVASIPGAVLPVPAMPLAAFLCMIAGGLWLMLWRTRWRYLGVVMIAGGIALAPLVRLPDLLVGRDAKLVAVRNDEGQLVALGSARAYELERWLENDGDRRSPAQAVKARGFACDGVGCSTSVRGMKVAVARHPAAFSDDCRRARVLVASLVKPKSCTAPEAVIDFFDARDEGVHAIYVQEDQRLRVETVAGLRGARPWSPAPRRRSKPQ